ncbi:hypothetical protein PanWU01x14_288050 [Parasponia andersonii]|uniref:Uncharacterized protein n=1 Tax=Parasponia andersonii TaxID=3476 RepID=A0A2P5AYN8_PARAD|nr:hypothetical protein PanWU01x14_288050 [Parasponia andersonii]
MAMRECGVGRASVWENRDHLGSSRITVLVGLGSWAWRRAVGLRIRVLFEQDVACLSDLRERKGEKLLSFFKKMPYRNA